MNTDIPEYTSPPLNTSVAASDDETGEINYIYRTAYPLNVIYLVIGFLGLLGNVFVVVVIFSSKIMRIHRTNIFIVNQCFIDATVAVFLILTTIFENDGRQFDASNVSDVLLCKLWLNKLWLWSFLVSSTYNLMALTFERYLAIVHPFVHKVKVTSGKLALTLAAVWLIGPLYNMAYMLPSTVIKQHGNCSVYSEWPSARTQNIVGVVTIIFQFIIPLFFQIACYALIALNLRRRLEPPASGHDAQSRGSLVSPTGGNELHNQNISSALKNIIKTVFIVSICFLFCWTWNQIYYLMFHLNHDGAASFSSTFYNFTVVMVFVNCCVNPFVYSAKYKAFQRATKNLFCGTHHRLWGSNSSEMTPT
ncbi:hypothetical protein LSH36_662g01002 [Paralvinella palmiformis]|uniref:G-protein coupled receptors family 1 profile domain-containing protein n=1 Tax=Paralvinella palmiformis TaxID=53620 RepID=A0AAD9MWK9_9ANNE|nr:hypothetical protein LSH36_662g01002 [Paralvinella palmiformis]